MLEKKICLNKKEMDEKKKQMKNQGMNIKADGKAEAEQI